jgi:hypothetical protein
VSLCPQCRQVVTSLHGRGRAPSGGDLVVCLGCGAVCVFTPALTLERLTPEASHRYPVAVLLQALAISDQVTAGHRRH